MNRNQLCCTSKLISSSTTRDLHGDVARPDPFSQNETCANGADYRRSSTEIGSLPQSEQGLDPRTVGADQVLNTDLY